MLRTSVAALMVAAGLGFAGSAAAQSCSTLPYSFSNGTTADASQVMANFNTLKNCLTGVSNVSGNVGIGTPSPGNLLSISGPLAGGNLVSVTSSSGGEASIIYNSSGHPSWVAGNGAWSVTNDYVIGGGTSWGPKLVVEPTYGFVGIGTTSPAAPLDVQTSITVMAARFKGNPTSGTNYIRVDSQYGGGYFGTYGNYPAILKDGVNYAYYYDTNNSFSMLSGDVRNTGAIYPGNSGGDIGADSATLYLRANTGIAFQNLGAITTWAQVTSTGIWANSFNNYSDARLKTNIQPLDGGLALVDKLRPVRYQFRNGADRAVGKALSLPANPQVGLIAQEVKAVIPEAVTADKDGVYGINQAELIPVLIDAVKELHGELETLKTQFAAYQKAHP